MSESERFAHMFDKSVGLVKPNRDLYCVVGLISPHR